MDILLFLLAAFIATSLMTLFSYIMAAVKSTQFKEPELLNTLISRTEKISVKVSNTSLLGWFVHYFIGFLFVICFDLVWKFTALEISTGTGAAIGFIAGVLGVIGWEIMFYLSPDEPVIRFKDFYLQLLVAHIIFGLGVAWTFRLW